MIAFHDLVIGLLIAHAACAYFFICGSIVYKFPARRSAEQSIGDSSALLDVILTVASGMAITGFATFVFGALHLIYPLTAVAWCVILLVTFIALGDSPLRKEFWFSRVRVWTSAFSAPSALALYVLMLLLSIPAYIPDTGSDATAYHVAYAFDWAKSHFLFVDTWLRQPYYANNWLLLDTWLVALGLTNYVAFLTWLAGALSVLVTYGAIEFFAPPALTRSAVVVRQIVSVAAAVALAISPTFLNWLYVGFIDVQIGFFFVAFIAGVMLMVKKRSVAYSAHAVACGAFLVGMKVSLIALLPLAVLSLIVAMLSIGVAKRTITTAFIALVVLSSPWYVKNFAQAGDPIAPTLNLAIHGVDGIWSKDDMKDQLGDLHTDRSALSLLRLPISIIVDPAARENRVPGVTLVIALIAVPAMLLALAALGVVSVPLELWIACCAVVYACAYWNLTSHLTRYGLLFYAALCVVIGITLLRLFQSKLSVLAAVLGIVLAIPAPASASWYATLWSNDYINEWSWYTGHDAWLEPRCAAYRQMEYIAAAFSKANRDDLRVYGVQTNYMTLYFKEHGLTEIGDEFGPARAVDFAYAIHTHQLRQYVGRFNIGAFLIPTANFLTPATRSLSIADLQLLDDELTALHYQKAAFPENRYVVYLAPAATAAAASGR